jgi:acetyltransferase-like isoleucine patch superfamily enzyme
LIQNANIGKFCSIANNVLIGLGNHPLNFFSTSPLFYKKINPLKIILVSNELYFDEYKPIHIGNDVWIGTNAIILDGVNIGNGAVIASNSVVTKNVEPYSIVGGVPAKLIKYRFTEDKISELMKERWWELSLCEIKKKFRL